MVKKLFTVSPKKRKGRANEPHHLQAQLLYDEMGQSEKKVADWLLSHPGEVLPYSITELAALSHSSEATIVRFSKRLGFAGYTELKLSLAKEHENRVVSPTIAENDSCFEILEKVCNDAYLSLERTKRLLVADAMTEAARKIAAARKCVLIGLGASASVAVDAANKFLRAGCNAYAYSDSHMQTIAISQLGEQDVVIGVSQSGSSKDIVEGLRLAKSRGATTISVTGRERSPIMRQSDIVLLTDTEEVRHSSLGLNSHISRLMVLDALCYYIAYRKGEGVTGSLRENERALASKRVHEE